MTHSLLQSAQERYIGKGMAVRLKVREIAEQKGYNISTLSRKADVGLSTVRRLWHDPLRHVDFYMLERLAKYRLS